MHRLFRFAWRPESKSISVKSQKKHKQLANSRIPEWIGYMIKTNQVKKSQKTREHQLNDDSFSRMWDRKSRSGSWMNLKPSELLQVQTGLSPETWKTKRISKPPSTNEGSSCILAVGKDGNMWHACQVSSAIGSCCISSLLMWPKSTNSSVVRGSLSDHCEELATNKSSV